MTARFQLCSAVLVLAAGRGLAAELDVRDIVRRAAAAEEQNWNLARKYAFSERVNLKHLNSDGKVESQEVKIHDVTLLDGTPYKRLVAYGDRPLTAAEERKEQEKLARSIAERKKESAVQRALRLREYDGRPEWQREAWRDLPEAFDFRQAADGMWQGRKVYVIHATPRRGFQPRSRTARAMLHLNCELWIDKQDFNLVKADVEAIDTIWVGLFLVRIAKGTRAGYEQMRVNGEVWLASQVQATISARLGLFKVIRLEHEASYSKCREYTGDSLASRGR